MLYMDKIQIALEIYYERKRDVFYELWWEFEHRETSEQKWQLISSDKLIKAWQSFVKLGYVKDTRTIDDIQDRILSNTIQLEINTELSGHTELCPLEVLREYMDDATEEMVSNYNDFTFNSEQGQYMISDYGLPKVQKLLLDLMIENDYTKKIVLIDRILNVVHPRTDLAACFVEGGSRTLTELSS